MEEEAEAQEAEQPPATEENETVQGSPEEEEEIEVIGSLILEEDGPTTRKIQTEFTLPCKGPATAAAVAAKGGVLAPPGPVYQPCGDMPLPPGADPGQWGFPEFCPRKMLRYAEAAAAVAAAAAAAEAADTETALPGDAVDTLIEEAREETTGEEEPFAEQQADDTQAILSVLSEDAAIVALGEEVVELEKSSSDVFMDAIGMEEHEEWWSDEDIIGSSDALDGVKVDIEVEVPSAAFADAGSVGFQAPAAAEEGGRPQEEAASEQQPAEEGVGGAPQPQQMDATEAMAPDLWKIEQEIAVVRSKLSEMQQKITALDIADLSGGGRPRKKCVCDPLKKAADRGLSAPPFPATSAPPAAATETGEKYVFHSAPCLQQYNQRRSFTNVTHELRPFPQQFPQTGGGVDIYIASRSGNTSAVTSINPANFQQYAEKPVLKAFGSPDVDVYVVTDKIPAPGYSGQS
ncbi:uncharacterized protein LOC126278738 [Schistocerca gregaria]|uniref:uncharacterized protein LOC126278738 n=1 Tax=Schistocerca gregaria TaxID=7010 RepID=UPI00211DE9B7|nr:uncharacterized protein LOC126278738 [Schistocerca gregaria]